MPTDTVKLYDTDGTLSPFVANPRDARVTSDFVDYAVVAEAENPGMHIIVTGRESEKDGDDITTFPIEHILGPELAGRLTIVSSHGLSCHLPDGRHFVHPIIQQVAPVVAQAHGALEEFRAKHPDPRILIEQKALTGLCINVNLLDEDEKAAMLDDMRQHFAMYTEDTGLGMFDEHGSIELRPHVGKKEGVEYFMAQGIIPGKDMHRAFFCDSLGEQGTDRKLADAFVNNGDMVFQVRNGKPDYPQAKASFATPVELCRALKAGLV